MATFPLCFRSMQDFERWRNSKNIVKREPHCRDCLPSYQLRMKKLGRCEHPNTSFSFDEDGGIVGLAA
jgi:hypothetical protein